jgi:hypothetical protein
MAVAPSDCIWTKTAAASATTTAAPQRRLAVLLLGYAGSPRRHLDQFADLYAQLGKEKKKKLRLNFDSER